MNVTLLEPKYETTPNYSGNIISKQFLSMCLIKKLNSGRLVITGPR